MQSKDASGGKEESADFSTSLLHPPPLDHSNPFLSPSEAIDFDVDSFLLSRAVGSTLNEITADLGTYSVELKSQLSDVVDRDFKGFVSLGAALKAEGPRIARLDWKVAPRAQASAKGNGGDADGYQEGGPSSSAPGSNLGLDRIRTEVVTICDQLRKDEDDVRKIIAKMGEAELQKANLSMLLNFHESLQRLEALLGIPSTEADDQAANVEMEDNFGQKSTFWQCFESVQEYDDSESEVDSSEPEQLSDAKHRQSISRPSLVNRNASSKGGRRSSDMLLTRRHTSLSNKSLARDPPGRLATKLNLPARVARASSEHAALMFLQDRAIAAGFSAYAAAVEPRCIHARALLKDDLSRLVSLLTRYDGPSLLVHSSSRETQTDTRWRLEEQELASWSPIESTSATERRQEQSSWLEMALTTWCKLPQDDPQDALTGSAQEAEATIRGSLITSWAQKTINADALAQKPHGPKTPTTPFGYGGQEGFVQKEMPQSVETDISSWFLQSALVEYSETDDEAQALIQMYNEILTFVSQVTKQICITAEQVTERNIQDFSSPRDEVSATVAAQPGSCDVFVRVVWNEIAMQVMGQLGGRLFFAGRPDVFHRNYIISIAFLSAFESLAPSERARSALRQHQAYVTFRKRWQLPVYFQMRMRDAVTRLESALSSSGGPLFGSVTHRSEGDKILPLMDATAEALALFSLPWKRGIHIEELMNRQWRLSLQVLSRYRSWIEEQLPSDIVVANRNILESTRALSAARLSGELARASSPSRVGTPTTADAEADDATISSFTVIAADLLWLEKECKKSFEQTIVPTLADRKNSEAVMDALKEALHESLQMLCKIVSLLSTRITAILKTRCAEPLRLVRSVSTQYRASGSTKPSTSVSGRAFNAEPSSFVIQFLRPVRHYLGKGEGKIEPRKSGEVMSRFLDQGTRSEWMTEVIEDFVVRYAASLQTMSKNYESLRRLKRGNAGTSASSAMGFGNLFRNSNSAGPAGKGEEDVEAKRMHSQMTTDVEFLEKEVQELATSVDTIVPTNTTAWIRLKEAARGEQEDG